VVPQLAAASVATSLVASFFVASNIRASSMPSSLVGLCEVMISSQKPNKVLVGGKFIAAMKK
jgi:hypothetical protein